MTANSISSRIVSSRFQRSVRIEDDLQSQDSLVGYCVTPQVLQLVHRFARALQPGATERAWTLTGPYGGGKSAFSLFLAKLMEDLSVDSAAWSLIARNDPSIHDSVVRALEGKGLLPVLVTARRGRFADTVAAAFLPALDRLAPSQTGDLLRRRLTRRSKGLERRDWVLREDVEMLARACRESGNHSGLLLVIDEMGKSLEYITRHPNEDIYVFQELAETASRSDGHPLLVVGVLHQAFEYYAEHLDIASRREWQKVQGRYVDVAFLEPAEQQMYLAGRALRESRHEADSAKWALLEASCRRVARELCSCGSVPVGTVPETFADLAADAAPLHPTVLLALPHVFRRFAQNERSLFAYLLGDEPLAVQHIARSRPTTLIRLPDLYDYFTLNLGGALARDLSSRKWNEVAEVLDRTSGLSEIDVDVVKCAGLMAILGESGPFRASHTLLSLALADSPDDSGVNESLLGLTQRSVLVYRKFNGTYRVWEGSDVDVEGRLVQGRAQTSQRPLGEALASHLPDAPRLAQRHSYETGALRFFAVRYADSSGELSRLRIPDGADGLIVCCLAATPAEMDSFLEAACSPELAQSGPVVVVIPRYLVGMREAAAELSALHWVWENTPELRDDRVARKEIADRIAIVEQTIRQLLRIVLDPRAEPAGSGALYVWEGTQQRVGDAGDVSKLLSRIMDATYHAGPRVRNELINRRNLSSAAAAARRSLIERMLSAPNEPNLGIDGFPPERSMYESVVLASEIHRQEGNTWFLGRPSSRDPLALGGAWREIEESLGGALSDPIGVDQLFDRLSRPPIGLMPGVAPVLLAAFLIANSGNVSLYREGRFIPNPGIADFEVLMRRPELFALGGTEVRGQRAAVVERLARSLGVESSILSVVRAVIRMVRSLPDAAWKTRELSQKAIRLREAFDQARSPERLLFIDIPSALGHPPFDVDGESDPKEIETFFSALNGALAEWQAFWPLRLDAVRDVFLTACYYEPGPSGWSQLRSAARALLEKPLPSDLRPLVLRLADTGADDAIVESVSGLLVGRSPRAWSDTDQDIYAREAKEAGDRLCAALERFDALSDQEELLKDEVTHRISSAIGGGLPPRVVRAALASLLQASREGVTSSGWEE